MYEARAKIASQSAPGTIHILQADRAADTEGKLKWQSQFGLNTWRLFKHQKSPWNPKYGEEHCHIYIYIYIFWGGQELTHAPNIYFFTK